MKKPNIAVCLILAAVAGIVAYLVIAPNDKVAEPELPAAEPGRTGRIADASGVSRQSVTAKEVSSASEDPSEVGDAQQTQEEKAEAEAEAKVEAFDKLTDAWLEPKSNGVTMKDVDEFTAAFRAVPKERKDECIHRALNLIPDENVMLLVGVLMDKSEDKEIVETVFNDILNRDEDVKKPILQQIYADKSHPSWADTAWILDVTGELPGKK